MTLAITIDGNDAKPHIKTKSLKISDQINNRTDVCKFVIEKTAASTLIPQLNDEVIITLDGTRIYAGTIISLDESVIGHTVVEYDVRCVDYNHIADRRLIVERYEDETAENIIADLNTNYLTGFTVNGVDADINIASIAFNRITFTQALDKLAKLINYSWYIDYNKDVHFFAKTANPAPISISDDSDNYVFDSLEITRDISQIRNSIFVRGGEAEGDPRTETYITETDQDQFPLANKFASAPTVTVDSVAQTVGVDFLDDDGSFDVQWNFNQKYIKFTSGNEPSAGSKVEITGIPLFPILVNITELSSIGEYGTFEFSIVDKTIQSRQQAIDRALAELDAYASTINEGKFTTYESGLRSGQIISVNSDLRGITEQFVIQKVDFKTRSNTEFEWDVTLATLKTVGIVEIMQRLLLQEELSEGEQETLLNFLQLSDTALISDELNEITVSSPPYVVQDAAESHANPYRVNFSTIGN